MQANALICDLEVPIRQAHFDEVYHLVFFFRHHHLLRP
jgi:hypothetical protein